MQDENSHGEGAAQAMETNGLASGSDNEGHKREDSDSEEEAPVKRSISDIECTPPPKLRGSTSDIEFPPKRRGSNSDIEGSPVKHRGCTSDMEEKETNQAAAGSDSENEDQPPSPARSRHSNARSDSETEVPEHKAQIESDGKDEECGAKKGKWKAVMHSDSEDEVEARPVKAAAGSGQEKGSHAKRVVDDSEDDDAMPSRCHLHQSIGIGETVDS